MEESYDKSRKARIGGTVGTVVGSGLAIAGFGLSFFTFGTSLALTAAGTVLSAAGGVTIAGSDIGYLVVSQTDLKRAQELLDVDREMMERAKKLDSELAKQLDSLESEYPSLRRENILAMLLHCRAIPKAMWCSYKVIDGAFDIGKLATTFTSIGKAGAKTTVWAGLGTARRVVGIVGVVFDAAFIPVDIAVMIKSSMDVHNYKTTGESNSDAANKIGELITKLEKHTDDLNKLQL